MIAMSPNAESYESYIYERHKQPTGFNLPTDLGTFSGGLTDPYDIEIINGKGYFLAEYTTANGGLNDRIFEFDLDGWI